jgi:hypothetical protein
MALARVVTFENVDSGRLAGMLEEMRGSDGPPADLPAKGMVVLHDNGAGRVVVALFFDSEEDYAQGDATLAAMPADETPGTRVSVEKYDVAFSMFV